ncbi:alpha-amylase family protein [Corallincola platygyrae]|uniref:Alpha-amylase n=1 Tax=Corallincola platygyrae TaxID=1193278 RepID=A0ABW4XN42_9GAMM
MKSIKKMVLSALIGLGCISTSASAEVILHAFNWKYSDVAARAQEIANLGYKKVLVSPAYKSSGGEWWSRYQPQDYRVIDSPLGNTQDFKAMINALNAVGVATYADIVFNHMANETWKREDLNYPGTEVLNEYASNSGYYNQQIVYGDLLDNFLGANDFHPEGCISNYNDVGDVQYWRLCGGNGDRGLPDLDPNNWVVAQQRSYLSALKSMGVKGFRVDAAKHMTNYHLNAVFTPQIKAGMHVFGEIITTGGSGSGEYDNFLAPYLYDTDHAAYDFPLFATLRGALNFGGSMSSLVDPGAYGQALEGGRAITFAITHDIPLNDGFRYQLMDGTNEHLAHAYVMGRDGGTPLIYSDNNESGDNRWVNFYKRGDIQGMLRFHNGVQGTGMRILSHNECHILFSRGDKGVVGINKCSGGQDAWADASSAGLWWYTSYRDTLDGGNVETISSNWHKFYLPPRSARMWLRD